MLAIHSHNATITNEKYNIIFQILTIIIFVKAIIFYFLGGFLWIVHPMPWFLSLIVEAHP